MNRSRLVVLMFTCILFSATASLWASDEYRIDPVHSTAIFRVNHLGSSWIYGRFDDVAGTFTVDEKNPADVKFDVEIKADTIDTNNTKRDTHLKSADFFSVKEFPLLSFKSASVKEESNKKYAVTGDLTIHGVTRSITAAVEFVGTVDASKMGMGQRAGYEAHFSIKRSDFGMDKMIPAAGDEVHITVSLEGQKQPVKG